MYLDQIVVHLFSGYYRLQWCGFAFASTSNAQKFNNAFNHACNVKRRQQALRGLEGGGGGGATAGARWRTRRLKEHRRWLDATRQCCNIVYEYIWNFAWFASHVTYSLGDINIMSFDDYNENGMWTSCRLPIWIWIPSWYLLSPANANRFRITTYSQLFLSIYLSLWPLFCIF